MIQRIDAVTHHFCLIDRPLLRASSWDLRSSSQSGSPSASEQSSAFAKEPSASLRTVTESLLSEEVGNKKACWKLVLYFLFGDASLPEMAGALDKWMAVSVQRVQALALATQLLQELKSVRVCRLCAFCTRLH